MKIRPFDVEQWMNKYEVTPGVLNIAETCAASISIDDLVNLCEDPNVPPPIKTSTKLTYGAIRGSDALRGRLASLYSARAASPLTKDNILITPGAIAANYMALYALVGSGDHVICVHPTYQQLYAVPETLGAEVSLWKLKKERKYIPDVDELEALVKENTKVIIINNPNNPTGATIPRSVLIALTDFARPRNIIIFSDEVYRPLFHGISPVSDDFPPSLASLSYPRTIISGSMSKAYSLAGIRIGWLASRDPEITEAIASARDYTTISVSQLDDAVASYALSDSVLHSLLKRNIQLAKTNVEMLEEWVREHGWLCSWVKPTGGTTAFILFKKKGKPVDDIAFCVDVIEKTKVMFLPGSRCFGEDFEGFVRIGFVCETSVLKTALERLTGYVDEYMS
ncbi:aminotransferas-like protein [Calycina marina]|uniref:Aminotransferas-like protein n=1 Tax=Calycina marina TaxID=1763456 RepID=A0A9P8CKZ1_9HELO|nr:aminotransferas-like protein [Calycina marina]